MNLVLAILTILWMLMSILTVGKIVIYIDEQRCTTIFHYIRKLFIGRNLFGIILSSIKLIISIPALLIVIFLQLLEFIFNILDRIWKLGDKSKVEKGGDEK